MEQENSFIETTTSTVNELITGLEGFVCNQLSEDIATDWVGSGVECKILQCQGGGWKKGKVRIRLEFIPDEIESPLDDLRSKID